MSSSQIEFLYLIKIDSFLMKKNEKFTFVIPKPFLSTFADFKMQRCTLLCNRISSSLSTIFVHGNSVGCWKKDMSGHSLLTSLSIWRSTSLSLKKVCHWLSGLLLKGWSLNVTSPFCSCDPGITIISSGILVYEFGKHSNFPSHLPINCLYKSLCFNNKVSQRSFSGGK